MTHTFFNLITLPEGKEEESFLAWQAVGRFMEGQPGFIGSTLYRDRRAPRMLINHGAYTDVESFVRVLRSPEFETLSQKLTDLGVLRDAGLYDEVESFGDFPPVVRPKT